METSFFVFYNNFKYIKLSLECAKKNSFGISLCYVKYTRGGAWRYLKVFYMARINRISLVLSFSQTCTNFIETLPRVITDRCFGMAS